MANGSVPPPAGGPPPPTPPPQGGASAPPAPPAGLPPGQQQPHGMLPPGMVAMPPPPPGPGPYHGVLPPQPPPAATAVPPQQPPAPAPAPAQSPDSKVVGEQFITQYYTVLRKSPSYLHRFFTEASTFAHAAHGAPCKAEVAVVGGQEALQRRVGALYGGAADAVRVDVASVDAQSSLQGGVIVQVTGGLSLNGAPSRLFAQTFFLATQPNGFFVLNDILRYTAPAPADNNEAKPFPPPSATAIPPVTAPKENGLPLPTPVMQQQQQQQQPAPLPTKAAPPPPTPNAPEPAPPAEPVATPPVTEAPKAAAPAKTEPATPPAPVAVPAEAAEPEVPSAPLTYAQRVALGEKQRREAAAAAAAATATHPERATEGEEVSGTADNGAAEVAAAPTPTPIAPMVPAPPAVPAAAPPSAPTAEVTAPPMPGGMSGASVFVRTLPINVEEDLLVKEFSKFGALFPTPQCPKGVNLKQQGSKAYAFVDFRSADAAAAAIEHGIMVGTKSITVEEKRPSINRSNRGGRGGRGMGGRRDGGRGGYGGRDGSGGRGDGMMRMGHSGGGRNMGDGRDNRQHKPPGGGGRY